MSTIRSVVRRFDASSGDYLGEWMLPVAEASIRAQGIARLPDDHLMVSYDGCYDYLTDGTLHRVIPVPPVNGAAPQVIAAAGRTDALLVQTTWAGYTYRLAFNGAVIWSELPGPYDNWVAGEVRYDAVRDAAFDLRYVTGPWGTGYTRLSERTWTQQEPAAMCTGYWGYQWSPVGGYHTWGILGRRNVLAIDGARGQHWGVDVVDNFGTVLRVGRYFIGSPDPGYTNNTIWYQDVTQYRIDTTRRTFDLARKLAYDSDTLYLLTDTVWTRYDRTGVANGSFGSGILIDPRDLVIVGTTVYITDIIVIPDPIQRVVTDDDPLFGYVHLIIGRDSEGPITHHRARYGKNPMVGGNVSATPGSQMGHKVKSDRSLLSSWIDGDGNDQQATSTDYGRTWN